MYKECKTEKSAQRQRLIENALFEMMKRMPYDEITVTDICLDLSMPRKAFYRYFDDKDSALRGMIAHTLREYKALEVDVNAPRCMQNEIASFFIFWKANRDLMSVLDKNGRLSEVVDLTLSFPLETIVSLNRLLPNEEDEMRDKIYRFAIGGLISIVLDWFRDGFKIPVDDISRLAVRVLTKPLFPGLAHFGMSDVQSC